MDYSEKIFEQAEQLPFPVVILGKENEILSRNRMARGLLLPLAGMERFFEEEKEKLGGETFFSAFLDERRYFIAVTEKKNAKGFFRYVFFFEDFGRLCLPVADYLLEQSSKIFQEGEEKFTPLSDEEKGPAVFLSYCKRLSLRTRRFREESLAYLRMSAAQMRRREDGHVCNLSGFFSFLTQVMKEVGFTVDASVSRPVSAKIHPDVLAEIFLNLFQFITLFEGEREAAVRGEVVENECRLTVGFPDRENLFELFGSYLKKENKKKSTPRFAAFSPLFAAALLCDSEGLGLSVERCGETCFVTVRLSLTEEAAERFLSADEADVLRGLSAKVREFFSL